MSRRWWFDRIRYEEDVANNGGSIRGVTPAAGSVRGYVQDAWHEFSGTPLPSSDSYSQAASLMNSGKSNIFNQAKTKVSERPDMIKDAIELKDADGKTVHKIRKTIKQGEDYDKDVTVKRNGPIDEKVTTPVKKIWDKKVSPVPHPQTGEKSVMAIVALVSIGVAGIAFVALKKRGE